MICIRSLLYNLIKLIQNLPEPNWRSIVKKQADPLKTCRIECFTVFSTACYSEENDIPEAKKSISRRKSVFYPFISVIISFTWDVIPYYLGYISSYMGRVFNYLGHIRRK